MASQPRRSLSPYLELSTASGPLRTAAWTTAAPQWAPSPAGPSSEAKHQVYSSPCMIQDARVQWLRMLAALLQVREYLTASAVCNTQ